MWVVPQIEIFVPRVRKSMRVCFLNIQGSRHRAGWPERMPDALDMPLHEQVVGQGSRGLRMRRRIAKVRSTERSVKTDKQIR